jgi:hypothetical protein
MLTVRRFEYHGLKKSDFEKKTFPFFRAQSEVEKLFRPVHFEMSSSTCSLSKMWKI